MTMTILATIIVLGVLIFVHELGHFLAAKAVGIEVQRFSIGLGPRVGGFVRGETEYVLSVIPLGGYVKMGGMDDEVMERVEGGPVSRPRTSGPRDFDAKPVWARTLVISAGVVMNVIFAFALYTSVHIVWGMPQPETTRVGHVIEALLPAGTEALATLEPGTRIVSVAGEAVHNWGDVEKGLYGATPGPLEIELADPDRSLQIQIPSEASERGALVASLQAWVDAGVGGISVGSPADKAGIQVGDRVVSVNGVGVHSWWDFVAEVERHPGEHVDVTLLREGHLIVRPVDLNAEEVQRPDGTTATVGRIGIIKPDGEISYTPASMGEAIVAGYRETVYWTGMILGFLRDLVTGQMSPRQMGSIVMIGQASGQAAAAGVDYFLRFMALFSLNLAVLNLLPIPVLDGGHLLFIGIEAVRGRSLSIEQRLRWSNVGLLIVVGIMLWALSNDFLRLLGL